MQTNANAQHDLDMLTALNRDYVASVQKGDVKRAGSNNLTGKTNTAVAALFQQDFLMKGVKLDAQVLATALAVYATDSNLDTTGVAKSYGFIVSGNGLGTATFNIGGNGVAFGVANNSTLTVWACSWRPTGKPSTACSTTATRCSGTRPTTSSGPLATLGAFRPAESLAFLDKKVAGCSAVRVACCAPNGLARGNRLPQMRNRILDCRPVFLFSQRN